MADDITPDERQTGLQVHELLRDQELGRSRIMIAQLLEEIVATRLDKHESLLNAMMAHSRDQAAKVTFAAPSTSEPSSPRSPSTPEPRLVEPCSPASATFPPQRSSPGEESRSDSSEEAQRPTYSPNSQARRWQRARSGSATSMDSIISANTAHRSSAVFHSILSFSGRSETIEEGLGQGIRAHLQAMLKKQAWDLCVLTLIMSNVVLIGIHVNMEATMNDSEIPAAFETLSHSYTVLFSVELLLRFFAEGIVMFFCKGPNLYWNWFDGLSVGSALIEWVIKATQDEGSSVTLQHARVFRVFRITRVLKVLRIARLLKYLRALRFLIYSILITLKSLAWALLLLVLIFYGFGVAFTQAVADFCEPDMQFDAFPPPVCDDPMLAHYWGSLPSSMSTLFKSISAGINWDHAVTVLEEVGAIWVCVFFCYVCFSYFAVLNVVTAVFCQSAIDSANADVELASMQSQALRNSFNVYLKKLFGLVDTDGSHDITLDEFEGLLREPQMKALFSALDIDVQDAWSLFKLLDSNRDGKIDAEEFVNGINNLRGNAKSTQMAQLRYEISSAAFTVSQLSRETKHSLAALKKATLAPTTL